MKLGIISDKGHLLGLAIRASNLGHKVCLQCKNKELGKGLVDLGSVRDCDFVITDGNGSKQTEIMRKSGTPVFGGGKLSDFCRNEGLVKLLMHSLDLPYKESFNGVRVHVGGFFNGDEFTLMFSCMNEDTFMEGGRGRKVDSMGCVLWPYFYPNNLLIEALFSLKTHLSNFDYAGALTLDLMLSELNLSVLELYSGVKYDALDAILELTRIDPIKALYSVARGSSKAFPVSNAYGMSISVTAPEQEFSANPEAGRHIWLKNAAQDRCLGEDVPLLCATARGGTVKEARKRAYRTVSNLKVQEASYRIDIGERAPREILKLDAWGWI